MSKQDRGFASMNREQQAKIASLGGKAAHAKGTAHKFTSEEARAAGRKGGVARRVARDGVITTSVQQAIQQAVQQAVQQAIPPAVQENQ